MLSFAQFRISLCHFSRVIGYTVGTGDTVLAHLANDYEKRSNQLVCIAHGANGMEKMVFGLIVRTLDCLRCCRYSGTPAMQSISRQGLPMLTLQVKLVRIMGYGDGHAHVLV